MPVAPLSAAWSRRMANLPGPVQGASAPGTPILVGQFGSDLRLAVEIAWGGSPQTDSASWSWTDITSDVQVAENGSVSITLGRADEASTTQPAQLSLTLDNRQNLYSQSALSPNWPNVRKNTPIRVRVIYQGVPYTRFVGYVVGFTPKWDVTGNYAVVALTASGFLRVLGQRKTPTLSCARQGFVGISGLVAYWPCEDGSLANQIAPATTNTPAGTYSGSPNFASNSTWISSLALPTMRDGSFRFFITNNVATGSTQMRCFVVLPSSGTPDASTLVSIFTDGGSSTNVYRWDIQYFQAFGGSLNMNAYDANGILLTSPFVTFDPLDGKAFQLGFQMTQSGSNINWLMSVYVQDAPVGSTVSNTLTGQQLGKITQIQLAPNGDQSSLAIGHLTVQKTITSIFDVISNVNGYDSEAVTTRVSRVCSQNGAIPVTVWTDSDGYAGHAMGKQLSNTPLNLLREAETSDLGLLADGLNPGLTFIERRYQDSLPVSMTLDPLHGDIQPSWAPVDDDQRIINKCTVSTVNKSSAVYEDTSSTLGTGTIGTYDSQVQISAHADVIGTYRASWQVHLGTVSGYRYPTVQLALHHSPGQLLPWLATSLLSRVDVVNMQSAYAQAIPGRVSLQAQGWTETIDQFTWDIQLNTVAYDPWRIIELAATTGDTNEFLCHLDADASTLAADAVVGATSLTVQTATGGALWTTTADDFPFDINVAGIQVTVTTITGASSPQTFTVTGVTKPLPAGSSVTVWNPPVVGM